MFIFVCECIKTPMYGRYVVIGNVVIGLRKAYVCIRN